MVLLGLVVPQTQFQAFVGFVDIAGGDGANFAGPHAFKCSASSPTVSFKKTDARGTKPATHNHAQPASPAINRSVDHRHKLTRGPGPWFREPDDEKSICGNEICERQCDLLAQRHSQRFLKAGDRDRTGNIQLGRLTLYQLSYTRG